MHSSTLNVSQTKLANMLYSLASNNARWLIPSDIFYIHSLPDKKTTRIRIMAQQVQVHPIVQGDIVWVPNFPLAQPDQGQLNAKKYCLVINHPLIHGGDALLIELTTKGERSDRIIIIIIIIIIIKTINHSNKRWYSTNKTLFIGLC
jgi:hypothetical protein